MENSGLKAYLKAPLRVPRFILPAAEKLRQIDETLAEAVGAFLNRTVAPDGVAITRGVAAPLDTSTTLAFDFHVVDETPTVRINLDPGIVSQVGGVLFGAPVDEPNLLKSVGEALSQRLADTVQPTFAQTDEFPSFGDFGDEPSQAELIIPEEGSILSPLPTMRFVYTLQVEGEEMPLVIGVEVARPATDALAPPPGPVDQSVLDRCAFRAEAVIADLAVRVADLAQWAVGAEIQMPGAAVERVRLQVPTPKTTVTVGLGELGQDGRVKCIRLTQTDGFAAEAPAMAGSVGGSGGFSAGDAAGPVMEPAPMALDLDDLEEDDAPDFGVADLAEDVA